MSGRTSTAKHRIPQHTQTRAFLAWLGAGLLWTLRRTLGFILGFAALALAAFGAFRNPTENSTEQLLALAGLCIVMLVRLFERLARSQRKEGRETTLADLELGTLFVAAAFVLIELTGGPQGLLYPLVFALIAFLVAFHPVGASIYFLALILGAEAAILLLAPEPLSPRLFISHASFVLLFGLLYALFLRGEVMHRKTRLEREIATRLHEISSEAREFRLTSGLSFEGRDLSAEQLRNRRRVGSVQAIHDSLYNVLAVAERALQPFTVALLWMDANDRRLRVKELRSHSDYVIEKPIAAGEGFIGAITKRNEPLVLTHLRPKHSGVVYYRRPEPITDFAGVPVSEGENLRGVLVADRTNGIGFDQADLDVMTTIAQEIIRAVQVERIFSEMDSEKFQREGLYQASRQFNLTLTIDDVAAVAIQTAMQGVEPDFAAVAVATDEENVMRIAAATWPEHPEKAKGITGRTFAAETSLVGAAIKARHPLPHGTARAPSRRLFDAATSVDLDYVKVLPLLWKDQGVGAWVLGSARQDFVPADLLEMLRVIADHAAAAVANAQMYERMEKMATTDGLTGLVNHRHFQSLFDGHLARAERYGRKLSLILLDIDHFKTINDTYGHPVGDMVLRRVARLLAQSARKTDVVARYGGEEFAVLMEETDRSGALQSAERIRQALEEQSFRCETGSFTCTASLGVATYPDDAEQKGKLTGCADQGLYHAKKSGRNQTVCYDGM